MSDEIIQCVECGRSFTWNFGEQRYYRENHLDPPKRCPACRSHRRNERTRDTPASFRRSPTSIKPRTTLPSTPPSRSSKDFNWKHWQLNPYWFYGSIAIIVTLALAAIASRFTQDIFWSYLIGINLMAFLLFGIDKLAAQVKWLRVPEKILIPPVLVFGFIGTEAGRRLFHHKVTDVEFRGKYWIAVGIESLLIIVFLVITFRS